MALPKKSSTTTQVNSWDKELAEQAENYSAQESSTVSGQFFNLRNGQLTFGGTSMPNNEIACIILDGIMENVLYEGAFDPDNPTSPTCFAFGRDEKEMAPHEIASSPQCENCSGCEKNQWGTAAKADGRPGKGKACRNTRRLAVIIAGNFLNGQLQQITDAEHFEQAKIAYMKLPVTSVKGYAGYVKSIGGAHQRPPHGMITRIKTVPDAKNQFSVQFEALAKVPNNIMETIMRRHKEATEEIEFPYQPVREVEEPTPAPAPSRSKAPAKAPAKRKY